MFPYLLQGAPNFSTALQKKSKSCQVVPRISFLVKVNMRQGRLSRLEVGHYPTHLTILFTARPACRRSPLTPAASSPVCTIGASITAVETQSLLQHLSRFLCLTSLAVVQLRGSEPVQWEEPALCCWCWGLFPPWWSSHSLHVVVCGSVHCLYEDKLT